MANKKAFLVIAESYEEAIFQRLGRFFVRAIFSLRRCNDFIQYPNNDRMVDKSTLECTIIKIYYHQLPLTLITFRSKDLLMDLGNFVT